jgi:organic radical activating enzyme
MIRVPKLEMHLAYGCTLRCEQCSHYSNYGLGGSLSLDEGSAWLKNWSARVEPVHFSFLGGEPLLNSDVPRFLLLARHLWKHTHIQVVTNGLLLPRCTQEFWIAVSQTETILTVSIHSRSPRYLESLRAALSILSERAQQYAFRFQLRNSIEGWYRFYRGTGPDMLPYMDGDPAASWAVCRNKHCVTLEKNSLWKCPPMAHLPRVASSFGLHSKHDWSTPLRYKPLELTATDDEIREFFARRAEAACSMCPASLTFFEKTIY